MSTDGIKEKEQDLQIGDLAHSYNPFSGHSDPAIVLDITGHEEEYGPYYKLLVTPRGEDPRIDESPAEYVRPFNAEVPLSHHPNCNLEARDHALPRSGHGGLDDPFADL